MLWSFLFLFELIVLFLFSRQLTKVLSHLLYRLTKSRETTIHILAFLFFPGVVVHELAHWFVAGMLFVRTGDIEFLPKIHEDFVKLGSVSIARTDPFRRFLIGLAPILIGSGAFFFVYFYLKNAIPGWNWQTALAVYTYIEIGNTMFSSRKDMEGALGLGVVLILLCILLLLFGVHIQAYVALVLSLPSVVAFAKITDALLLIPLCGDMIVLLLAHYMRKAKYPHFS